MDNRRIFSTEIASVALNDALQDSKSQNCKIRKCHSEKRDMRNEAGMQDVIENVSSIYIESSDEDDAFEGLSGNVEQTETQFSLVTGLGSSADGGKEFAYCIPAINLEILKKNILKTEYILSLLTKIMEVVSLTKTKRQKRSLRIAFCNIKR